MHTYPAAAADASKQRVTFRCGQEESDTDDGKEEEEEEEVVLKHLWTPKLM